MYGNYNHLVVNFIDGGGKKADVKMGEELFCRWIRQGLTLLHRATNAERARDIRSRKTPSSLLHCPAADVRAAHASAGFYQDPQYEVRHTL